MNKNLVISVLIIVAFVIGIYFVIKNAPEREVINNQSTTETMNQNSEVNQNTNTGSPSTQTPSMVVVREGTGNVVTKSGDTISVVYTGTFENGEVFDSNVESGEAFEFTLGAGQVISGWDIGLVGMKVGEVRNLTLPPTFAYGSNAVGPIPANSTLIFEVELKAIK